MSVFESSDLVAGAALRRLIIGAVTAASAALAGCSAIDKEQRLARVAPLFSTQAGEGLDTCLADPRVLIAVTAPNDPVTGESDISAECRKLVIQLRDYKLHTYAGTGQNSQAEWQRNEIVDALIAVSNNKCGEYAAHLKTFDGQTNSSLSILSILLGGAGGIVTGADAARLLSGSSAIVSGSRVALNDSWFSSQTIHVLVAALEKARERQRRDIKNRQSCPINSYPLMHGFGDAMKYHASCSLLTGLAETAQAVERSDQPGLDTMRRQLADLASIREQAERMVNASMPIESTTTRIKLDDRNAARAAFDRLQDQMNAAKRQTDAAREVFRKANPGATPQQVEADSDVLNGIAAENALDPPLQIAKGKADLAETALTQAITADNAVAQQRRASASSLTATQSETAVCPYIPPVGAR